MRSRSRGHAVLEFALAFPFFLALVVFTVDLFRLIHAQYSLERRAFSLARNLARSSTDAEAIDKSADVDIRPLGALPGRPGERVREASVLRLTLARDLPLLGGASRVRLRAVAWEPRVRIRREAP